MLKALRRILLGRQSAYHHLTNLRSRWTSELSMPLTDENRQHLLVATREAAAALAEDMTHVRETLNRSDPDRGGLRRLSAVLRRILIDNGGDLRDVAAPRIGRFQILSLDNKPVYKADKERPYAFFGSGGVAAFGISFRAVTIENGNSAQVLEDFDPDRTITLSLEGFLGQQVLCLQGDWVTRRDAVKYIANIASGVHSGTAKDDVDRRIARLRSVVSYRAQSLETASINFDTSAFQNAEPPFRYQSDALDPVLVEVLATAHFLAVSPDIGRLEEVIRLELAASL
jgi:hypothetical protein